MQSLKLKTCMYPLLSSSLLQVINELTVAGSCLYIMYEKSKTGFLGFYLYRFACQNTFGGCASYGQIMKLISNSWVCLLIIVDKKACVLCHGCQLQLATPQNPTYEEG